MLVLYEVENKKPRLYKGYKMKCGSGFAHLTISILNLLNPLSVQLGGFFLSTFCHKRLLVFKS
ncbi:hypothetical protein HC248_02453 [Polaromonas vacuolata]|uniref:Uncharacterized protein n=1 Tax=Polaromonas vacuolata TaxID=37448 RepID=A0A6H2HBJ7_9BURK|nr:hypothetical protein HC248_02453 [Polaromonas vacuolata]